MKKLVLFASFILFACILFGQDEPIESMDSLLDIILQVPKVQGMSVVQAFTEVSTYIAAVFVLVSVYGVKWVPGLGAVLDNIKPYWRAITVGVAVLWLLATYGKLTDTQVGISFILSNALHELIKIVPLILAKNAKTDASYPE